jgi:cytochrome c oxidase subunit 2
LIDLTSDNVIHSFWVPELAGKLDMIPGKTNRIRLLADEPGVYYGTCAEYCGGPHALMQFQVRALPPADYVRWLARESGPARAPAEPLAAEGAVLFQTIGCGGCHAVRGTRATGEVGPDLTHVASRLRLGAGILPNNEGTLGGWIANPQRLKPGVKMPAYSGLSARELRALSAYLEGLE